MTDYRALARNEISRPPLGDPEEMKRYARWLESRADLFRDIRMRHDSAMNNSGLIEGGLARRLLAEGAALGQAIETQLVKECDEIALEIRQAANRLAREQENYHARVEQLARLKEAESTGRYTDTNVSF